LNALICQIKTIRIFVKITRKMTTKLTLMVEKDVIERAKHYAKNNSKSLSHLVETFLNDISKKESGLKLSSKLSKIVGSVKLPKDFNEDKELRTFFENKHL
jgi:formiminotetrahydrofolate cyclodeaminase